jgi:multidrug efflux pump subunit AcrA (membrane-fusion protein)
MNTQTRQAIAFADIEPGKKAHAGTYIIGRILLGHSPAFVVPASSIVIRDGYSFIFEVTPGQVSRVAQQRVDVGRRNGTEVEILTGLKAGERVVAQGAGFLDEGDIVHEVRKPRESPQKDNFQ